MSKRRVVVTGLGVLSSVGCNLKQSWENIVSGKSGITNLSGAEYENLPCKVAGFVRTNGGKFKLSDHFSKSELRSMCPATGYALLATKEALEDSNLEIDEDTKINTGVAVGMGMIDLQVIYINGNTFIFTKFGTIQ